jgi:NAD(P)-dependent dehydrogenase (short-subunit alcohol dehydrogenase family)
MSSSNSFEGRIALVTGASRGIGRAAALALADEGAHVIAVARTVGALEELDDAIQAKGGSTTLVPLDLKDSAGIDRMGAAIFERWGKLDILFANAGILGVLTPLTHLSPRVWDELIAVNLTANWRLIRSLDQLLRLSDAGRALFMSSGAAVYNRPFWGGYAVSKAALDALVKTYAAELTGTTVRVNLLYPGPTRTGMRAQAMPGEDPMTLPAPEELCPLIIEMLSPDYSANGEVVRFSR